MQNHKTAALLSKSFDKIHRRRHCHCRRDLVCDYRSKKHCCQKNQLRIINYHEHSSSDVYCRTCTVLESGKTDFLRTLGSSLFILNCNTKI